MAALKVAVCDDEKHILKELCVQIEDAFLRAGCNISLQGFDEPLLFWKVHETTPFDVVFLDIDMPEKDGIELGRLLRSKAGSSCLIYISNWEERVFETFSVTPLRFIRKSRFAEEIGEAILAILKWREQNKSHQLVLLSQGKLLTVPVNDILYVECWAKVQNVVTVSGDHEIRKTLRELEEQLKGFGFLQPHKGYLVNYRFISRIESSELFLKNGTALPISKYRHRELKQEFLRLVTQNFSL